MQIVRVAALVLSFILSTTFASDCEKTDNSEEGVP
jgi:hypothetical protein